MLIPVILSGGAGTRLWPVSRKSYPKPFMRMPDGRSLLHKTLERALDVNDGAPVLTVTGRDYYFLTRDEYNRVDAARQVELPFLLEPSARNTAPATVMAALQLVERYGPDVDMLVLPADHLIRDLAAFRSAVEAARKLAADGYLVTFGIPPTQPETGFGYIRTGLALDGGHQVEAFVEKPDLKTATGYVSSGRYAWNSGMFCFRASTLLEVATEVAAEVAEGSRRCWQASRRMENPVELHAETFAALPDISIDYAIMERAPRAAVVPGRFDWSDIGSWKAVSELEDSDDNGNRVQGKAILVDSENCYIQSEQRMIAAVGVSNLLIVDTGDALLVVARERAQAVKLVVEKLRADNHNSALFHQTVHRPWGSFTVLEDGDDCKVKRLVVKPGQVLSLQLHHRRSEHWTVVQGTAKVRVSDREFMLNCNESCYIPVNTLHRLENPTSSDIHLIEVQVGDYFGEDDIVRLEDRYGRIAQEEVQRVGD